MIDCCGRGLRAPLASYMSGTQLGAAEPVTLADPCAAIDDPIARDTCRKVVAGQSPATIAQGLVAYGGTALCVAAAGAAMTPLCAAAANALVGWIFEGMTPAERAANLFAAAVNVNVADGLAYVFTKDKIRNAQGVEIEVRVSGKIAQANVRYNLKLLGVESLITLPQQPAPGAPATHTVPKADAVPVIVMAMVMHDVVDKGMRWWLADKREPSDFTGQPAGATQMSVFIPIQYQVPPGTVAVFDNALKQYRLVVLTTE